MNRKKLTYIIVGIICIVLLVGGIFFATSLYPRLSVGNKIVTLLEPIIKAENQSMDISIDARVKDEVITMESEVYFITEDDMRYLVMEQKDFPIFIADNLLLFENGKAFLLGEETVSQTLDYKTMFSLMLTLFEELDITEEKSEFETSYAILVTGEQMKSLLTSVLPSEEIFLGNRADFIESVEQIQLKVVEKEEKIHCIELIGNGNRSGSPIDLRITITDIEILESGIYSIPEDVKESIETVDRNTLFNLSEDLFRLVKAVMPLTNSENLKGNVNILVDCGLLQINTKTDLEKLKNQTFFDQESSSGTSNNGQINELPKVLAYLAMESNIQCIQKENSYVYSMTLDADTMQELAEMIAPEIAESAVRFSNGDVTLVVLDETLSSMEVSIKGKINAFIVEIPASVGVEFTFK